MFYFLAFFLPTNLRQTMHSPTAEMELPSPNLARTFSLHAVCISWRLQWRLWAGRSRYSVGGNGSGVVGGGRRLWRETALSLSLLFSSNQTFLLFLPSSCSFFIISRERGILREPASCSDRSHPLCHCGSGNPITI